MSKLLGVENINKILNTFLEPFDATAELGSEFCYLYITSTIYYTVVMTENQDKIFNEFFKKNCPEFSLPPFIWGFLHELGHHETMDDLTEDETEISRAEKEKINKELAEVKEYNEIYWEECKKYCYLPDEYAASMWAIDYAKDNYNEVMDLTIKLFHAIDMFYKLNNIEN